MMRLASGYTRPRLFNWITILLVTAWVALVGILAAHAPHPVVVEHDDAFVASLVK